MRTGIDIDNCISNYNDIVLKEYLKQDKELRNNGIKIFTMNTKYNQEEKSLERVSKWKEIYERISKINKKKILKA